MVNDELNDYEPALAWLGLLIRLQRRITSLHYRRDVQKRAVPFSPYSGEVSLESPDHGLSRKSNPSVLRQLGGSQQPVKVGDFVYRTKGAARFFPIRMIVPE